jgi:predicted Zn-dependent protease with MMP-like domain
VSHGIYVDVPPARFAELVAQALDSIPPEIGARMENVAVMVDDHAPPGRLLGLYEGIPLTSRGNYGAGGMAMPDRITLFRRSICSVCDSDEAVVAQVRVTVIHEVGHHFGISDARLHELGWA